jgi:hypothetical protein
MTDKKRAQGSIELSKPPGETPRNDAAGGAVRR